jgi:four helix bundle protein
LPRLYETLVAWQRADDLVVEIYRVTRGLPKSELYGLTSQMRRAAVSVAANIAEGSSRQYLKAYLRFLHLADASLSEVAYYVHLAGRLGLVDEATAKRLEALRSSAGRPLYGLMDWVKSQMDKGTLLNARLSEDDAEPYSVSYTATGGDQQPETGNR